MPGTVNPVICESVAQVGVRVIGNVAWVTCGGFGGIGSMLVVIESPAGVRSVRMQFGQASIDLQSSECRDSPETRTGVIVYILGAEMDHHADGIVCGFAGSGVDDLLELTGNGAGDCRAIDPTDEQRRHADTCERFKRVV